MHENSVDLMRYFHDKYLTGCPPQTVLDIGSMCYRNQPTYRPIFANHHYTGMDVIPGPNVDIVGYEGITGQYDVVISGQVMEHVEMPWEWLPQIFGYTRRLICIIAPNTIHEHRYPIDTFRFYPDGMRVLFRVAGIRELEIFRKTTDTIGIGMR